MILEKVAQQIFNRGHAFFGALKFLKKGIKIRGETQRICNETAKEKKVQKCKLIHFQKITCNLGYIWDIASFNLVTYQMPRIRKTWEMELFIEIDSTYEQKNKEKITKTSCYHKIKLNPDSMHHCITIT